MHRLRLFTFPFTDRNIRDKEQQNDQIEITENEEKQPKRKSIK